MANAGPSTVDNPSLPASAQNSQPPSRSSSASGSDNPSSSYYRSHQHQHRPPPLPLTTEDRSRSWHSDHSTRSQHSQSLHTQHSRGRQARTPPLDSAHPQSAASTSGSAPHTATGFRHRKASMDVDLSFHPGSHSHARDIHELRQHTAQRYSLDMRQKPVSRSRDVSPPPHSAKSNGTAPVGSGGRFGLFPPHRPARLTHSLSDAPPSMAHPSPVPERKTLWARLRPWSLAALWVVTTLGFLIAIAFWKKQVFSGLDSLATWLRSHGVAGYLLLYSLIFITTIPPLPMYSTLITLAGYCFGTWMGAVVSYSAALTGAVVVFVVSRQCFPGAVHKTISASPSFKKVIRAIEKRPRLLFLIRLAPYPYNMMNVLLSSSPYLTLSTYTLVTALSLFKCLIYTYVGSAIHSFADYHSHSHPKSGQHTAQQRLMHIWGIIGVILCVGIMIYLTYLARKAVNEADADEEEVGNVELGGERGEEAEPFLGVTRTSSPVEMSGRGLPLSLEATEVPFRTTSLLSRPPTPGDGLEQQPQ